MYQRIVNLFRFGKFKTDEQLMDEEFEKLMEVMEKHSEEFLENVRVDVLASTVQNVKNISMRLDDLEEVVYNLIVKTPEEPKKAKKSTKKVKSKK